MYKTATSMGIAAALLAAFGVVGAGLVAVTYDATAERIAQNEREVLERTLAELLPSGAIDNDPLTDTIRIEQPGELGSSQTIVFRGSKQGEPAAVVFSPVEADGYAGPIRLIVAILEDGRLGGVRVLGHKETPGLGDKIDTTKSDWITGFSGLSLTNPGEHQWKVKRDGGAFDQFTGATVTPRAVVTAVKKSLVYTRDHWGDLFAEAAGG